MMSDEKIKSIFGIRDLDLVTFAGFSIFLCVLKKLEKVASQEEAAEAAAEAAAAEAADVF